MGSRFDKGTRMTSEMPMLWPRPCSDRRLGSSQLRPMNQALHRVRSRLVSERTAVINQIRGFLLERGIIVRQGLRFLRQALPGILKGPRATSLVTRNHETTQVHYAARRFGLRVAARRPRAAESNCDALAS